MCLVLMSSGDGVAFVERRLASLLAHSIFAISVASQPGISGIAQVIMNLIPNIICCKQTHFVITEFLPLNGNCKTEAHKFEIQKTTTFKKINKESIYVPLMLQSTISFG